MSTELVTTEGQEVMRQAAPVAPMSSLSILEAAVRGGVTSENVAVVKELVAMRREEMAMANKSAFNRAFFNLKDEISRMSFYADKEAKTKSGDVAYTYCSESELSTKLEPVLSRHGFTMLFGQRQEADRVVAIVTLIHREGHEETREYSVRVGQSNSMKDATAVDSGSTTSAWRHLVIKMFGLKSRIREQDDARNEGGPITEAQAFELERRTTMLNINHERFLKFAGAASYAEISSAKYSMLDAELSKRERAGK